MTRIALATYELHPVNPGGAGVFLAGAARLLSRAGFQVTVVCDFPAWEVEAAQRGLDAEDLGPGTVRTVCVPTLLQGWTPPPGSHFEQKSAGFAEALRRLYLQEAFDLVEFPEYGGVALATLQAREAGTFPRVPVVCRLHGSLELIERAEGSPSDRVQTAMHAAEAQAMRRCDGLLSPSPSLGQLYARHYGLEPARLISSPPPMEILLQGLRPEPRLPDPAHFMLFGKLQEVKGVDTFAQAGVALIGMNRGVRWRFTLVGRDTYCARHRHPVSRCLDALIPGELKRECFEFVPFVDRQKLSRLTRTVQAAVVPSRFETFCLAAHELRAVGVPLIVPRIPAFVDWLHEGTGCLTYDGTANGLRAAIDRLRHEPGLARTLEQAPPPRYPPFAAPYLELARTVEALGGPARPPRLGSA
jgi:glycosyltransferase involved in cell wall biosynthesis